MNSNASPPSISPIGLRVFALPPAQQHLGETVIIIIVNIVVIIARPPLPPSQSPSRCKCESQ